MQKAIHLRLCQCPERGGLHFYEEKYDYALKQLLCVNALKGATFISTLRWMNEISPATIVSMPWKRRPSFLLDNTELLNKMANCVNALKGATFISTLASGNPCKSRLCGSIFPEVFQNILKKAFLNGVFWKFTICSYLTVPFLLLVYLFFLDLRSTYSTLLIG